LVRRVREGEKGALEFFLERYSGWSGNTGKERLKHVVYTLKPRQELFEQSAGNQSGGIIFS